MAGSALQRRYRPAGRPTVGGAAGRRGMHAVEHPVGWDRSGHARDRGPAASGQRPIESIPTRDRSPGVWRVKPLGRVQFAGPLAFGEGDRPNGTYEELNRTPAQARRRAGETGMNTVSNPRAVGPRSVFGNAGLIDGFQGRERSHDFPQDAPPCPVRTPPPAVGHPGPRQPIGQATPRRRPGHDFPRDATPCPVSTKARRRRSSASPRGARSVPGVVVVPAPTNAQGRLSGGLRLHAPWATLIP